MAKKQDNKTEGKDTKDIKRPRRAKGTGMIWRVKENEYRGKLLGDISPNTGVAEHLGSVIGDSYEDADKKLAILKFKIENVKDVKKNQITVDTWVKKWLETEIKTTLAPESFTGYESQFFNHIIPVFGKFKLQDLTKDIIQQKYSEHFAVKTTNQGGKNETYSQTTVSTIAARFKLALQEAVKADILLTNPHVGVQVNKLLRPAKLVQAYSAKVQLILTAYCKQSPYNYLFFFLFVTGCRIGEALGLTWDCVDFDNNEIVINQISVETKGKARIVYNRTKTRSGYRTLPLRENLKVLLLKLKELNKPELNHLNLVFPSTRWTIRTTANTRKYWEKLCVKVGVEYMSPHSIRHSFATRWLESGKDIVTLSVVLGHKSSVTTMKTYAHVLNPHKTDSMSVMDIY